MNEVLPGVHRLELPAPLTEVINLSVNAYVIEGAGRLMLVDTGWNTAPNLSALEEQLARLGAGVGDISDIVVTHAHPDHYGMAGRLKGLSGARLAFHEQEKAIIRERYANLKELQEQTSRWLEANGMPPKELGGVRDSLMEMKDYVVPAEPDVTLRGGETIAHGGFRFRALWTPGHSSGHICLYEPERKLLIAGDHILPTITPNVGVHPQSIADPLGKYIASLRDIRPLDIGLVLPGHEEPFADPAPRIEQIIRHHEARNREILAAIGGESLTAYRVASLISWAETSGWADLPFFHKRLAISETLAHLEMLASEGRLGKSKRNGIISYRQN